MNYEQLRNDIIEVIRTNGNEEITGEVLQFVLLEMVSGLGAGYRFLGTCTPSTEPQEPDGASFYVGGAGDYQNFGGVNVDAGYICFFKWDGSAWSYSPLKVTQPVDAEITEDGQNPVCGGAIYDEFKKLRDGGYLFAGLAMKNTEPIMTENVFYLAAEGGAYPNFNAIVVPQGISVLKWNGSMWSLQTLWTVDDEPTEDSEGLVKSGSVWMELSGKVEKVQGKGLSEADFTNVEKLKLGNLPTAAELTELLDFKQDKLTFDNVPEEGSTNPVTSAGIHEAIKDFITKAVNDLLNYYKKSEVYTKAEIDSLIAGISQIEIIAVEELPEASAATMGKIFLVPAEIGDSMDEYITLRSYEGGVVSYYWQKIGSSDIDLSNYPTIEDMNTAIATALADYYTKARVDALICAAIGTLANITLEADKEIVLIDTATVITVTGRSETAAESLIITRGGVEKAAGSGKVITASETLQTDVDVTYLLTAVIGGVERTKELTIKCVGAIYYGAGADVHEIITKASPRESAEGFYTMQADAGDSLFVLVPDGMTIRGMRMSGVDVPLDTPTGVVVDDSAYLCYKSANTYKADNYVIEVY
jgi:hypothetical protein